VAQRARNAAAAEAAYAAESKTAARAARKAAEEAATAAAAAAEEAAAADRADLKRIRDDAEKAQRAVRRRLDAARDAEDLLRANLISPPETAMELSQSTPNNKLRLTVHEAERCLAVLDILRGAVDPSSDSKHSKLEPRWLDASFCHRLPPRAAGPYSTPQFSAAP